LRGLSATAELFVIIHMRKIHIYLVHKKLFLPSSIERVNTEEIRMNVNARKTKEMLIGPITKD